MVYKVHKMKNSLVSIIIPTYNRATLICETLDSIIAQSYQNWECIIIDDRSTDKSAEIIKTYCEKDSRIYFSVRQENYPKGANACRNIGKRMAKGEFLIFFDSDDLMLTNHIEEKVNAIESHHYDFAIAKSEWLNPTEKVIPMNYRELGKLPITADYFIQKKINWLTLDPIIRSSVVQKLDFTEKNNSAEEYNFFCKLLLATENAIVIDKILTKRRSHEGSYQSDMPENKRLSNYFLYFWITYKEIKKHKNLSNSSRSYLLNECIELSKKTKIPINPLNFYLEIIKEKGVKRAFILFMNSIL